MVGPATIHMRKSGKGWPKLKCVTLMMKDAIRGEQGRVAPKPEANSPLAMPRHRCLEVNKSQLHLGLPGSYGGTLVAGVVLLHSTVSSF